ncbi:MAG: HEPN domain-containing protein [candidate division KSB1 bacterium]|nr:HEPN domain-containing protein [candidate division KSB1 bacterium]
MPKIEKVPETHGSIVRTFGEVYVKPNIVDRQLGRNLNRGLDLRNRARYDPDFTLSEKEAEAIIKLAEQLEQIAKSADM